MANYRLLWADDEIQLLKSHILFLKGKGYEVDTVTNGWDAIDQCASEDYDLILLDENMPGISGLETLKLIKEKAPQVPVVMVTKSEEENIMNQAIGAQIADYLIKPVNPTQILLSLKKNIHQKDIRAEVTQTQYQQSFGSLAMEISDASSFEQWAEVYKKLTRWEQELMQADGAMREMLTMQKAEANQGFAKFVKKNYIGWIDGTCPRPMMSPDIFKTMVLPALGNGEKVTLVVSAGRS